MIVSTKDPCVTSVARSTHASLTSSTCTVGYLRGAMRGTFEHYLAFPLQLLGHPSVTEEVELGR
jgi:hypothetical protein